MGNSRQILDKIARNLEQRNIAITRDGDDVKSEGLTISYTDAEIQSPMGGVDSSISPYLGIGIANPGSIKIKGDATENTLAAICNTEARLVILRLASGMANDIAIEAGDTATELAKLPGHADLLGMGQ